MLFFINYKITLIIIAIGHEDQKRDQIVFSLPLSEIKTNIFYPNNHFTFKELVALINAENSGI